MTTREEKNKEQFEEIVNDELRKKKKKKVIFFTKLIVLIIVCLFILYFYVTYVSTKMITVKEERLKNSKLPISFNSTKIIQFSDLHYGTTVKIDEVKNLVKLINKRHPDIVVFTGDLIDDSYDISTSEQEDLIKLLKSINVSIGKYAVSGEDDGDNFSTILNQSDFTVLDNNYDLVYNNDNNPILITGLSSSLNGNRNIDNAFKYFSVENHNANIYSICLIHESDDIDDILSKYSVDLFLGGHSHNGQIRIPFYGAISGVEGSSTYYKEHYELDNSQIYVSSGIGTVGSGIRLFDRPSINFFRLSNS